MGMFFVNFKIHFVINNQMSLTKCCTTFQLNWIWIRLTDLIAKIWFLMGWEKNKDLTSPEWQLLSKAGLTRFGSYLNPFHANFSSLYPLKTFPEGIDRDQWHRRAKKKIWLKTYKGNVTYFKFVYTLQNSR